MPPKLQDSKDLQDLCQLLGTNKGTLELELGRRLIGRATDASYKELSTQDCLVRM